MRIVYLIITIIILQSCESTKKEKLTKGTYRAKLKINKTEILPFTYKVVNEKKIEIYNADEIIKVTDITYKNDSVYIKMPVFTSYLAAKINNGLLQGSFIKKELNRTIAFTSTKTENRFKINKKPTANITGNWKTTFSPKSEKDKYYAQGIFKQNGNIVTGTFRTKTGDYRYLEGVLNGNQLKLSTFDGAHAFLFTAIVNENEIQGTFYSGNHWSESFIAVRNGNFKLPNANTLTSINKDVGKFHFSFPDETGKTISLTDKRFQNNVVIVQLFGTWCPNCLDESRYYSEYNTKNKGKNVAFVALAFEYVKTKEKAFQYIKKFKKDLAIEYPILLAQYGTTNKKKAQEKIPILDKVRSYPTTIILDAKGNIRKIHTGFNGPATGQIYLDYKKEFESFIDELLAE